MNAVLTADDIRAAISRIASAPTRWPRIVVAPADYAHLNEHDGGRYGCPRCERIWRLSERIC